MKKTIVLIILLICSICSSQNKTIDSLFIEFKKSSFYGSIYPAKMKLENFQKKIIPKLIKLTQDTSFVKLTETADLIYPGADKYYGHGYYIPYDMDWISVRAGWLLEDLTFQNFGYKTTGIDNEYLFSLMKENYNEYLKKGTYDLEWKNKTEKEKKKELRKLQAKKVEKWWKKNKKEWTRLSAIKEALKSNDEIRLSEVLQYLRFRETKCDNYDQEIYVNEIKPLVEELKTTQYPEILTQVKLLLGIYQ